MAGYPGPHTLPSVPSALYPPQAAMLDTHHAHTHPRHHVHTHSHAQHLPQPHGHDMALWGSAMEVRDRFYTDAQLRYKAVLTIFYEHRKLAMKPTAVLTHSHYIHDNKKGYRLKIFTTPVQLCDPFYFLEIQFC